MTGCPKIKRGEKIYLANDFITPDNLIIQKLAESIRKGCKTKKDCILKAFNFVSTKIRYISDKRLHGLPEYWQFPEETLRYGAGDCEDSSFLLASILLALGFPKDDVRVALGAYEGAGHAWVEVKDGGVWYLLESTSDEFCYDWCFDEIGYAYKAGYEPELYVYKHICIAVGRKGIYDRYPLYY